MHISWHLSFYGGNRPIKIDKFNDLPDLFLLVRHYLHFKHYYKCPKVIMFYVDYCIMSLYFYFFKENI